MEASRSTNEPAQKISRLSPSLISLEEIESFPEIKTASNQLKEKFLLIRNYILQCWSDNPMEQLSVEKCMEHWKTVGQQKNSDTSLIERIFAFLERYGYINFGLYKFLKFAPKRNKSVVIIGAGICGLIAARQLEAFGFDVLVLEGRDRIGGRMALMQKPPFIADLGAMVITGLLGNPIVTIASQMRINLVQINDKCHLFDYDGTAVTRLKDELIEKEFNRLLESCAFLAHNVDVDRHRSESAFSLGETIEIIIQMQEKLIKDKQLSYYKGLCNMQERLLSVLHKVNRKKTEINRLHQEYLRASARNPPSNDEENAMQDFTVRYKKYELGEACKSHDELIKIVEAMEAALTTQEQLQPSDVYLSPKDRRMLDWHFANLEFANAAPLDQLSLKHWDQDDVFEFGGPHLCVPSGYASMPILLAEGLNIQTGSVVNEIRTSHDGCHVKYLDEKTGDQKVAQAAAVLCTVPLGILKKSVRSDNSDFRTSINFEPQLPQSKIDAINRLGFGNLNKVILCFDRVFWDPACHMFGYISEKTDARGEFFLFWTFYDEPTVIALIAGRSALILEHLDDEILVERCLNVLRTIFSPSQVPTPKETMVTRWSTDPFSMGSYSFVAVGASGEDYDTLAEPVTVENHSAAKNSAGTPANQSKSTPRLFFAGEHTCRRYPATVHGAVISGLGQAGKIVDALSDSS